MGKTMTHPLVQKFLQGKMDAGGTIFDLEAEIEKLTLEVISLGVQNSVKAHQIQRLTSELTKLRKFIELFLSWKRSGAPALDHVVDEAKAILRQRFKE